MNFRNWRIRTVFLKAFKDPDPFPFYGAFELRNCSPCFREENITAFGPKSRRPAFQTSRKFLPLYPLGPNGLDYRLALPDVRTDAVWNILSPFFLRHWIQVNRALAAEFPLETAWQQRHLHREGALHGAICLARVLPRRTMVCSKTLLIVSLHGYKHCDPG